MNFQFLNFITLCSLSLILAGINWWGFSWNFLLIPISIWILLVFFLSLQIRWNFFVKSINKGFGSKNKIALTFDDGPHPIYTPKVLELLAKHKAKATFFCIGKNIKKHPEILKTIIEQGHTVGNHSFSHSFFIDLNSTSEWLNELNKTDEEFSKISGLTTRFFRPPFGVTTPHLNAALLKSGHLSIGWNLRTFDTTQITATKILDKIQKRIKPGSIILLHDKQEKIVKILEQLLPKLSKENYTFVTINELIDENPYT